ncbi:hypothetical protein GV791_10855 [Nocardia cyriacigeorgica]|uniref:Integral membrane protein n=1 Tax=Nocardia cyriacigeorgica TaxID=135487 RepID=A0A6P1CN09_9NOCA|nr:hypothetical protein [Nocardia cyriacigeorgica]MBF6083851.1 hypothetical protein [Nocardia cyriacigeorgica]NEW33053.1 hypothetical protein [Nocardia cyriacigeorgica]BDU04379.1 hypothetical protein FMUBM48_06420 [Nocardia cyriacigeorgica]
MTNTPSQPPSGRPPRRSGDWLLQLALGVFTVGLLAIVAIFLTPILTDGEPGLWLYLLAMLTPIGFVLALVFTLRSGRRAK